MNPVKTFFLCCLLAGLAGCASLGLLPPESWNQRLAYANAGLTSVYQGITLCVQSASCSKETGKGLIAQADTVRTALDIAGGATGPSTMVACLGQDRTALSCLQAAQDVLTGVETYLRAQ